MARSTRNLAVGALALAACAWGDDFCADKVQQGLTPAPADWPGNVDCRGYFNCWHGNEPMLMCPSDTVFDPALGSCQWASQVDWVCGSPDDRATTTPAPAEQTTTTGPTPPDQMTTTTAVPPTTSTKSLAAFVENWLECPSLEKVKGYSKILISFAVTYQYQPSGKHLCDETCTITPVYTCENAVKLDMIRAWQASGAKVLVSFGGAAMGESWVDRNHCWVPCFSRVDSVVSQLTQIVSDQGLDGVDIDYEYILSTESAAFLSDLTVKLKTALGPNKLVSHAPMEPDLDEGDAYFNVLKSVSQYVDFLLPQYYNGYLHPKSDMKPVLVHFGNLVSGIFNGDASKVIFGFCISDTNNECGSFTTNADEATHVLEALAEEFPDHGGAYFWRAGADVNGAWSSEVAKVLGL